MERCGEFSKVVVECRYRNRIGFRIARCETKEVTQMVCVSSSAGPVMDAEFQQAIQRWRQITKVDWSPIPLNWVSYHYIKS